MTEVTARTVVRDVEVVNLANQIASAGPDARVVYDVETSGLHPYAGDYLTGMSVCIVHPYQWTSEFHTLDGWYVPLGHETGNVSRRGREALTTALGTTEATHVGFNTPFDWPFLMNEGLLMDVPVKAHDVQIKRWLQDENGIKALKKLGAMWLGEDADREQRELKAIMAAPYKVGEARKSVLAAYPELGLELKSGKLSTARPNELGEAMAQRLATGREWGQLTVHELGGYAARDATMTAELDALLDGQSPESAVQREMMVNAICIDMTRKGVSVDVPQLKLAAVELLAEEEAVRTELLAVHGLDNPNSGPQVADLLYNRLGLPVRGRTPSGEPATDKNALEQLAGDPVAAQVLLARKLNKARTAYCEPFIHYAEASIDGRVHGMYGTTRTVTGRLAASGPNVMTIPREDTLPSVRKAFNLDPAHGTERLGFDLASAELWVTASITQDPVLTSILQEGRNLHAEMMVQVFGGEKDKSRREYTLSKNVNYGIEYGAGLDQITIFAAKAGYNPAEARRVAQVARDGHRRMFHVQHERADWWAAKARELGKLPLKAHGRYRHFKSPGKQPRYYTALNALVQGGVAEFMKDTMVQLYREGYGEHLILQVHDELVFDVPAGKDMQRELLAALNRIAVEVGQFRYPLTWDAKSWSMSA